MKTTAALRAMVLAIFSISPLAAQEFGVDWFAIDGGGGTSTGGEYSVSGSIGQVDAGNTFGGDFAVIGGFWSIVTVVESAATPSLRVSLAEGRVIIAWPENGNADFVLEETTALSNFSGSTPWTAVHVTPEASNGTNSVSLPPAAGNHFYRLHKP